MGRIDVIKGLENLVEAISRLPAGLLTLKLCGSGDENYVASLQQLVTARGLDDQIQFAGQVTGDKREEAFSESDLLVLPVLMAGVLSRSGTDPKQHDDTERAEQ